MADNVAPEAVRRSGQDPAVAARTAERLADARAIRARVAARPLRPSQVAGTGARSGGLRPAAGTLRPSQVPLPAGEGPRPALSIVREVLRGPGAPLDAGTRSLMEERLGADFSQVRIHADRAARASAAEVGARAYTVGDHVALGDGGADKHTLAHELAHVTQQRQGQVAGTGQEAGPQVISDPSGADERAAEASATRALHASPDTRLRSRAVSPQAASPAVARQGAGRGAVLQRKLTQDLPEGEFRKADVTPERRAEITESARTFATGQAELESVYRLLRDLGYTLDKADQFMEIARVATALPSRLEGRFSGAKRENLVRGYRQVRQAEEDDLAGQASREIRGTYPLTHIPAGENLTERLTGILTAARAADEYITYAFLKKYIDKASDGERKAAGQSDGLLALILERLSGRTDFPKIAVDLQIMHAGKVTHYKPEPADAVIRRALGKWIPDLVFGNQSITGKAAILRGQAWENALRAYLTGKMPEGQITSEIEVANAFTAPDGYVFLNADRGNPGTMIHEGTHFYAPDDFLRKYGEPLNEGVTEYFARKIARDLGISRDLYPDEYAAAKELVQRAGEATVLNAYFKGGRYLDDLDRFPTPVVQSGKDARKRTLGGVHTQLLGTFQGSAT